jgi:release factor glutamine methyltransferase
MSDLALLKLKSVALGIYPKIAINQKLSLAQEKTYNSLIKKYSYGYPLDYLLPYTEFGNIQLTYRKGVFIGREETLYWLEKVWKKYSKQLTKAPQIIDLCSGPGTISIWLAKKLPLVSIRGVEIDEKTIAISKKNTTLNNVSVRYTKSNLLSTVKPKKEFILFCNPPYVPTQKNVEKSVQFEPKKAIYSGKDGLFHFKKIIKQLNKKGWPSIAFFELDPRNIRTAQQLIPFKSEIMLDQYNRQRVLIIFNNTVSSD